MDTGVAEKISRNTGTVMRGGYNVLRDHGRGSSSAGDPVRQVGIESHRSHCILCEQYDPLGHPEHPESRGLRSHDYEGLRREIDADSAEIQKQKSAMRGNCSRKRKLTQPRAEKAAKRLSVYRQTGFNVYRCIQCRYWHVGKSEIVG